MANQIPEKEPDAQNGAGAASQKTVLSQTLPLDQLYLDPNNFRLIHEWKHKPVQDDQVTEALVSRRTSLLLRGDQNQHVQDLISSFLANGYLPVDQIQVRKVSDQVFVVVEGNRRVATLKYLQDEFQKSAMDLGNLDPALFDAVPVVLYPAGDHLHHLTLAALKHISGNKKWGEWNQAKLIEALYRDHGLDEGEICDRIGIQKVELRRNLRALALLDQYLASDYGDQFDQGLFPIFREAVRSPELKSWLSWNEDGFKAEHAAHLELFFSLISKEPEDADEEDGGTAGSYLLPAIVKRDQVRQLSKMLHDERAMAELIKSRDLAEAYRASDLVLEGRLETAIKALNKDIETLGRLNIDSEYHQELETASTRLRTILARTEARGIGGVSHASVFHDVIDAHFSSLHIQNYKKLYNLRIDTLSRINLFAGVNNCGKTTLLEAVLILARQNDADGLLEVIRHRGKMADDQMDVPWVAGQMPQEIKISGVFDGLEAGVELTTFKDEEEVRDQVGYMTTLEISARYGEHQQKSTTRLSSGRDRQTLSKSIKTLCPVIYSSPFFLNEPHRHALYYDRSFQSKALPQIWGFLRESLIPTLNDIRMTKDLQHFNVDDKRFDEVVDLSTYGEGVQRVFFLGLLFASAANGILLIDEFENAIHTHLMAAFAPFIHGLARLFNVQVFLTSHSKECLDAFVNNIPEVDDFSYHALVQTEEGVVVRQYSGKKWARLLDAGDVDLRSIQ